ncbi:hypothetical protein SAMN04489812_4842 [Microlunatus soli]|uniref:DUF7144 domain-containing protein n=2 Tax=Microlunatus soli TaxID=630515 RepID=A0A1H1YX93_9ACTN|nr:hypothetical protein SAMN04489812_4842 [Microlunatus soli]
MSTTSDTGDFDLSAKSTAAFTGTIFGGTMLITAGLFQVLQGIAAIARDKVYVTGLDYSYAFDLTAWGWIHLVIGVFSLVVGGGVLISKSWALVAGVILAGLSALANFAFMPYYPLWSLLTVAFDVFVIWALCTQLRRR